MKGHNVTVITPVTMNDSSLGNVTEIFVSSIEELLRDRNVAVKLTTKGLFSSTIFIKELLGEMMERVLSHPEVQKLFKTTSKFDVVIAESHNSLIYAFGYRFKVPVIGKTFE